jgi:hypothetical protein
MSAVGSNRGQWSAEAGVEAAALHEIYPKT